MADKERLKIMKDAASNAGLKKVSIDKLIAEDFDIMETVQLLTDQDISALELSRGQERLLEQWVAKLQVDTAPQPSTSTSGQTADLDTLVQSITHHDAADDLLGDDLQDFGSSGSKNGRPFLICDY